ncbi:MAG: hypothetical protein IJQ95_03035 [Paludibacteraceae bacterium]|nr:hypothetical protein [Paludibacteraceae bacterium]
MKARIYIIIICCLATMSAYAQYRTYNQVDYNEMTSSQAVMNSPRYSSPIYEPFSNTLPSEQTDVTTTSSGVNKGGPRKSLIGGPEDDPGPSPIGDAVVPLVILALISAGVIAIRRKRNFLKS